MPWSEWITSEPVEYYALDRRALNASRGEELNGADESDALSKAHAEAFARTGPTQSSTVYGDGAAGWADARLEESAALDTTTGDYHGTVTVQQDVFYFTAAAVGVPDRRNYAPVEMDALVEGVDYAVRPDRTGDEPDAYIEYDTGDAELVGWVARARAQGVSTIPDAAATGLIAYTTAPVMPPSDPAYGEAVSVPPFWVDGTTAATITVAEGEWSPVVDLSSSLGAATEVAVTLTPQGGGTYIPDESGEHQRIWDLRPDVYAAALVTFPRWRYWIPGVVAPKPLRQRQRGDGLGLSVGRWRASGSRQSSNRWRGYL